MDIRTRKIMENTEKDLDKANKVIRETEELIKRVDKLLEKVDRQNKKINEKQYRNEYNKKKLIKQKAKLEHVLNTLFLKII